MGVRKREKKKKKRERHRERERSLLLQAEKKFSAVAQRQTTFTQFVSKKPSGLCTHTHTHTHTHYSLCSLVVARGNSWDHHQQHYKVVECSNPID